MSSSILCFDCGQRPTKVLQSPCNQFFCWECVLVMGAHNCRNCGQFHTVNSFAARTDLDQILAPPQTTINCQYCLQSVFSTDYDAHLLNCVMIPVPCQWGCGATVIKREMTSHARACPFYPITCEYCGAQLPSINYYEHKSRHEAERLSGQPVSTQPPSSSLVSPPVQSPPVTAQPLVFPNPQLRTRPTSAQAPMPIAAAGPVSPTIPLQVFAYLTMFWTVFTSPSLLGHPRLVQMTNNFMDVLRANPTFIQLSQRAPSWLRGNHVIMGTGLAFAVWLLFGILGFLFRIVLGAGFLALIAVGARVYMARR